MTAPKMMLASGCAASATSWAASLISNRPRSEPPEMRQQHAVGAVDATPRAAATEIAISAASTARSSPRAEPMPISAEPAPDMTDLTSAKSRLIRPGVVIRSVMPGTPCSSTWSADLNASSIADAAVGDRQQPVVGDDDEGVDLVAQLVDAGLGRVGAAAALEAERAGDDADGQRAERAGDAGDDGRAAGAGAAALAGRDEDHVGPLEDLLDLLGVVLGGLAADLGVGAGAEAAGELAADVELDVGVAHQQRLRVGVDRDELDALEADLDHPVDGVHAAAADADDLDDCEVVLRCCHVGASPSDPILGCGLDSGGPGTLTLKLSLIVMSTTEVEAGR